MFRAFLFDILEERYMVSVMRPLRFGGFKLDSFFGMKPSIISILIFVVILVCFNMLCSMLVFGGV